MATARVLVIEDNPANLELMRYLLEASGYAPDTACDGRSGLARARKVPPDVVLCDIQLPDIDGFEVLKMLRAAPETAGCKVVAVTAYAMVGDRARILAAGFDGYLSKPIEPETFVSDMEAGLPPRLRSGSAACIPPSKGAGS